MDKDRQEIANTITSLKTEIEKAKREGIDTSSPIEILRAAANAYRSKDFKTASEKVVECQEELDVLLLGQTVKDVMNMGECLIRTAQNLGIDTSEAEKGMETVRNHLGAREYMEALQVATRNAGTVDGLCKKNVDTLLLRVNPMILEAKANDIDVITVEVLYKRAREYQRKHQYDKAARYANRCFDEIHEIEDRSQRAASIIRLAEGNVLQAKFFGAKVGPVQMMLDEAYYELKNGQYDTSIKLGKECIKMANQAKENVVWDTVISFQTLLDERKNGGSDTSTATKLVEDAKKTLKDMDNTTALELLMQSESETGKTEWQENMIKELIHGMDALINEAEKRGIECKQAQKFHRKAESALLNKRYAEALESIVDSGFELSEAQDVFVKARTLWYAAEARIDEAKSTKEDSKRNQELLTQVERAFTEKDYKAVIRISMDIIYDVKQATAADLLLPIKECEILIENAKKLGLDVTRACAIVDEAKFALEDKMYSNVKPFTQNCKKIIEREISGALYKELYELKNKLNRAKGKGLDTLKAEELLEEVEECLENKEYPVAAQLVNGVKEILVSH